MIISPEISEEYESLTIDELVKEIAAISSQSEDAKENFLWCIYDSLKTGTVFKATADMPAVRKQWANFTVFEDHIIEGIPQEPVTLFPELKKGESVMFLGMSEEVYPYKRIDRRPNRQTRRAQHNVIISDERSYPKWLVGEKVRVWPLDITKFEVLVLGSGPKKLDEK